MCANANAICRRRSRAELVGVCDRAPSTTRQLRRWPCVPALRRRPVPGPEPAARSEALLGHATPCRSARGTADDVPDMARAPQQRDPDGAGFRPRQTAGLRASAGGRRTRKSPPCGLRRCRICWATSAARRPGIRPESSGCSRARSSPSCEILDGRNMLATHSSTSAFPFGKCRQPAWATERSLVPVCARTQAFPPRWS